MQRGRLGPRHLPEHGGVPRGKGPVPQELRDPRDVRLVEHGRDHVAAVEPPARHDLRVCGERHGSIVRIPVEHIDAEEAIQHGEEEGNRPVPVGNHLRRLQVGKGGIESFRIRVSGYQEVDVGPLPEAGGNLVPVPQQAVSDTPLIEALHDAVDDCLERCFRPSRCVGGGRDLGLDRTDHTTLLSVR